MTTFTSLIKDLPERSVQAIDAYASLFGRLERKLYADMVRDKESQLMLKKRYIKEHLITSRQFNAIWRGLQGKLQSKKELAKLYIADNKDRIKSLEKTILSLRNKAKSLSKTGGCPIRTAKFRFKAHQKSRRLSIVKQRLTKLQSDQDFKIHPICFGSKKLLNAQHHLEKNGYASHKEWLDDWKSARNGHFYVLGSKDESWGNQGAQLIPHDDGSLKLLLRLPDSIGGGRIEIPSINFKYGREAILKACASNQHRLLMGSKENLATLSSMALAKNKDASISKNALLVNFGQAITVRFNPHKFGWQISVSVDEESLADDFVGFENGCLGVDVNADHLAVTVVNKQGNKVFTADISCPLTGKMGSGQRAAFIGDAVKEVVEIAKQYKVGISHESLDFQRKKRALKETTSKGYRSFLSSFAYNSVLSFLTRRAYRQGVLTKSVNPACTSIIGGLKYQNNSLTSHQSAAMVIARRGLGIWFEKIRFNVPSKIGVAILNAQPATVSMPADPFRRWAKTNNFMKQFRVEFLKPEKIFVNLKVIENSLRLAS